MSFTQIDDVNQLILHTLDDKSVFTMTQVNKNFKKVIFDDKLLKAKFVSYNIVRQKVKKIIAAAKYNEYIYVRITLNHMLTVQKIHELVPTAKNIKFRHAFLYYKIKPYELVNSIESIVNEFEPFDLNKIFKNDFSDYIQYVI
jgi:hypothetical protein